MPTRRITLYLLVSLVVLLTPAAAHAVDGLSAAIGNIGANAVMDFVIAGLTILHGFILEAIGLVAGGLQWALEIDPSSGGSVVYTAWRTLRDMCNMAFIIALIMMSFGTIFDSLNIPFLKPYSISGNGRGIIVNFLMAAILLNFSLAIGQTVVAGSNQVSNIVITLLPKDLGPQIAQRVGIVDAANRKGAGGVLLPNIPPEALSASQYLEVQTWTPEKLALLQACLRGDFGTANGTPSANLKPGVALDTPMGCFDAVRNGGPEFFEEGGAFSAIQAGLSRANTAILNIPGITFLAPGYVAANTIGAAAIRDPSAKLVVVRDYAYNIIMLSSLLINFTVITLFLLVRIPAIWILLALSPLAWTALAFPGLTTYKEWWKQFWAWNLFSPLYLFVLYIGMLLLQNTNVAVASLGAQGSAFIASIGGTFQYLIAFIVFTLGTGLVLKASFLSGTAAGAWVGKITALTGTGGDYGSFGPVVRFIGQSSGATAAFKGAVGGVQSKYDDLVTKPNLRRQEDIEARYRGGFGDKSALEALQQKRIKEQIDKNKERGTTFAAMRKDFEAGPDKDQAKYFAAGKALLDEGELDDAESKDFLAKASVLSPKYGQVVREAIQRKVKERVEKKKLKTTDEVLNVMEQLNLQKPENKRGRETFLNNLRSNQPLLYAQLAGNAKGIPITKKDGTQAKTSEILEELASKLSDEEWVKAYKEKIPLGENANYVLESKLNSKDAYKLLSTADPETRDRLGQEILGRSMSTDTEAGLTERERGAKERGRGAQEEFKKAKAEYDRDPTNVEAKRAMTGAVEAAKQARAELDEVRAKLNRQTPAAQATRPSPRPTPSTPPAPVSTSAPTPVRVARQTTAGVKPAGSVGSTSGGTSGTADASSNEITVLVFLNNRPMGSVVVPKGSMESDLQRAALALPTVAQQVQGKAYRTFYARGLRIFNITTT